MGRISDQTITTIGNEQNDVLVWFAYPADHPLTAASEEQTTKLVREYKVDGEYLSVHPRDEPDARDDYPDSTALMVMKRRRGRSARFCSGDFTKETSRMVDVFIEITGQSGHRTTIPGGPFPNKQAAHAALNAYAVAHYQSYLQMIQAIDAYGFVVHGNGGGTVRTETKP